MTSVHISFNSDKGSPVISNFQNSYILQYPCVTKHDCDPYTIELNKGFYKIECWG